MRSSQRIRTTVLFLLPMLLVGCFSLPRENLEIIRYSPRPDSLGGQADTSYPFALSILPFEASAVLRGDRMVAMDDDRELATYYYHRWIAPPEELITDLLTEDLTESGLFAGGIYRQAVGTVPRYEVHGRVVHLYADNRDDREQAVFEVVLSVFRMEPPYFQKDLLLQRSYHYDQPRQNRRVESFVPASSLAVARWLTDVRTDLAGILADDPGPADSLSVGSVPPKGPQRTIQQLQERIQGLETQLRQSLDQPESEPDAPPSSTAGQNE